MAFVSCEPTRRHRARVSGLAVRRIARLHPRTSLSVSSAEVRSVATSERRKHRKRRRRSALHDRCSGTDTGAKADNNQGGCSGGLERRAQPDSGIGIGGLASVRRQPAVRATSRPALQDSQSPVFGARHSTFIKEIGVLSTDRCRCFAAGGDSRTWRDALCERDCRRLVNGPCSQSPHRFR